MSGAVGELHEAGNSSEFKWRIPNFSSMSFSGPNDSCRSNTFTFMNTDYRLHIYGAHPQSKCHTVFLNNENGISNTVTCTLSIPKIDGTYFANETVCFTSSYFFKNFINVPYLQKMQSESLPEGTLTILCTLERSSQLKARKPRKRQETDDKNLIGFTQRVVKRVYRPASHPTSFGMSGESASASIYPRMFQIPHPTTEVPYNTNFFGSASQPTAFNMREPNKREVPLGVPTATTDARIFQECSHCKKAIHSESISLHERQCMDRPIKCPECTKVVLLQNWNDHKCQNAQVEAATNTTGSFVVHHHDKILQDLKQLFLKQKNCDVVLKVKGQEFQAHKTILAARSPVFASTFENEKKTAIIDVEDCDPSIFSDFLCFLYSDAVDNLCEENVSSFLTAADKYDVLDLRKVCLEFMKEYLTVNTFCKFLTLALQRNEAELIHFFTDFFIKNAKEILLTVKWQSFAAVNPIQSNKLFIKFVESVGGTNS